MTKQHAVLAPSSAARNMQCPGSRALCEQYPEPQTAQTIEGEFAHEVMAAMLAGQPIPQGATDEMIEGGELMIEAVGQYLPLLSVESMVNCSWIHVQNWGTPDAYYYGLDITGSNKKVLKVYDYKFGHDHVEVFENWQLLNYAGGIFSCNFGENMDLDVEIELVIVQPRSYHRDGPIRKWALSSKEALQYFRLLQDNYKLSIRSDAHTQVGPECIHCSASHACQTLQKSSQRCVEMSGDNTPFDLPDKVLSRELDILNKAILVMKARASGLESEVLSRIKVGINIPGWRTEQGLGREKWRVPVEEVVAMGQMMGVDISRPGALTPKQAIKKGLAESLVKQFSETPYGEIKLVQDDLTKSRRIFK